MTGKGRIVVLDRDGVINRDSDEFVKSPAEWLPLPGSLEAIARLTDKGFRVVVATNQSGVGRGLFSLKTLAAIHARMHSELNQLGAELAGVFFCPHHPDDGCACRKPAPGLLREIEQDLGESLRGQAIVGDSGRDLDAALAVGGRAILVRSGNGAATEHLYADHDSIEVFSDLAAVSEALIAELT